VLKRVSIIALAVFAFSVKVNADRTSDGIWEELEHKTFHLNALSYTLQKAGLKYVARTRSINETHCFEVLVSKNEGGLTITLKLTPLNGNWWTVSDVDYFMALHLISRDLIQAAAVELADSFIKANASEIIATLEEKLLFKIYRTGKLSPTGGNYDYDNPIDSGTYRYADFFANAIESRMQDNAQ
jgi:hypothetical protein